MTDRPNAGRRGHKWQKVQRPAALAQARGRCYLCGSNVCPKCGRTACGGATPPGTVHHLIEWSVSEKHRENPANHVAAHLHCNIAASRRDNPSSIERW